MTHRLKLAFAAPISAALMAVATVTGAASSTVYLYPYGAVISPTQVYLAAQVTCSPDTLTPDLSVTLRQGTNSGYGNAGPITCDNQPHYYPILVTANAGSTFVPGPATAYVDWSYRTCTTSSTGQRQCVGNESVVKRAVTLYQVPPGN